MSFKYEILSSNNKSFDIDQVVEIKPLGYGGAFATEEGHSSFLVTDLKAETNLLIDCGSLVYGELRKRELTDKIDAIFITHTHEDHIGSLSGLIYENWFIHQKRTIIFCHSKVRHPLTEYLITVCGHQYKHFDIPYYYEESFNKIFPAMSLDIFNTTNFHFPNFPSSGLVLTVEDEDDSFKIVFSGDLGVPLWDFEERGDLNFQDAGTYKYEGGNHYATPHAYFKDCDEENVYLYHHYSHEVEQINEETKKAKSIASIVNDGLSIIIKNN